jgi:transcription-repair coupling factor (superfamily II helicase)
MRDLEIRGAGNLLGTAQSGHIVNIGFDLYCQLLQQAVARLKGSRVGTLAEVVIRLDFLSTNEAEYLSSERHLQPAFIPADYMAQPQMRIEAYKKLAQAQSTDALLILGSEWRDRFGQQPPAVRNLLLLNQVRVTAAGAKITSIEVKETKVMLIRGGDYLLIGDRFPRLTSGNAENTLPSLLSLLSRLS